MFKILTLKHLIEHDCLFDDSLGFENIGDEGAQYIASALKENQALKELAYV